jgi:hypothetical protein
VLNENVTGADYLINRGSVSSILSFVIMRVYFESFGGNSFVFLPRVSLNDIHNTKDLKCIHINAYIQAYIIITCLITCYDNINLL